MAPTRRPMFDAKDRNGPLKWNSLIAGVRISALNSWRNIIQFLANRFRRTYGPDAIAVKKRVGINLRWSGKTKTYANHPKPATTNRYHYDGCVIAAISHGGRTRLNVSRPPYLIFAHANLLYGMIQNASFCLIHRIIVTVFVKVGHRKDAGGVCRSFERSISICEWPFSLCV